MTDPILTSAQLGRALQSARKSQGMTQHELASRVGLSQKRISALELRPGTITVEQLLAMCSALGLEISLGQKPAVPGHRAGDW